MNAVETSYQAAVSAARKNGGSFMHATDEAAKNVAANGAICSHPRTGSPIENPYLKIQAQQGAILTKMRTIKSDRVSSLLSEA